MPEKDIEDTVRIVWEDTVKKLKMVWSYGKEILKMVNSGELKIILLKI